MPVSIDDNFILDVEHETSVETVNHTTRAYFGLNQFREEDLFEASLQINVEVETKIATVYFLFEAGVTGVVDDTTGPNPFQLTEFTIEAENSTNIGGAELISDGLWLI